MQENTPREVELDFSSNEERIEDLEAARAELSGELNAQPADLPVNNAEIVPEDLAADEENI